MSEWDNAKEAINAVLNSYADMVECYNSIQIFRFAEQKTPKQYGEYLQKKRQGKRRYK